jgi:hypothetical protein
MLIEVYLVRYIVGSYLGLLAYGVWLRITQNSQKFLRKIRIASTRWRKGKIQSPQNSTKLASSRRVHCNVSSDINGSSNGVTDRKIWPVKAWSTRSSQPEGHINIHTVDVNMMSTTYCKG